MDINITQKSTKGKKVLDINSYVWDSQLKKYVTFFTLDMFRSRVKTQQVKDD